MPGKHVPAAGAVFTANGDAQGYLTVGDNTVYYKGAQAFLNGTALPTLEVKIVEIAAAGKIRVQVVSRPNPWPNGDSSRGLPRPNYGGSDISAYTTVANARIDMPDQFNYSA